MSPSQRKAREVLSSLDDWACFWKLHRLGVSMSSVMALVRLGVVVERETETPTHPRREWRIKEHA